MATYKIILTVKDNYGKEKEIEGGVINIDLANLNNTEVSNIIEALNLDSYATDVELETAIKEIPTTDVSTDSLKYSSFDSPIEKEENAE